MTENWKHQEICTESRYQTRNEEIGMEVNDYHRKLSHLNEEIMRNTAKHYTQELKGKMNVCEDCSISNIKKNRIPKETTRRATKKGEMWYMDLSSIKAENVSNSKFWVLMVDNSTRFMKTFFLKRKSELYDKMRTREATKNELWLFNTKILKDQEKKKQNE